jgi:hypothetical protein
MLVSIKHGGNIDADGRDPKGMTAVEFERERQEITRVAFGACVYLFDFEHAHLGRSVRRIVTSAFSVYNRGPATWRSVAQ